MTPAQRDQVCAIARRWIRTPWHHRARVEGVGVDCAQLLIAVYAEAGLLDAFDPGDYAIDQMLHSDREDFRAWCARFGAEVEQPQPGDVVLWRFGRSFSHGGIVVSWPDRVIHAYRPWGGVAETPADVALLNGRSTCFYAIGDFS